MKLTSRKKVCKVNIDISKETKLLHMKFKEQRECGCRYKCKCNTRYKGSSAHNERLCKRKAVSVEEERIHSKRSSSTNNNNIKLLTFKVDLNEASKTMIDYNSKNRLSKGSSCSKGLHKKKMTMSLNGIITHKKKVMNNTLHKMIKFGNNALQQGKSNKDSNNIMVIKSIESNCNSNNKRTRSTCMSPLNQSVKICSRKYYTCKSLSQERSKRNALKTQDTKLIELHDKIKKISALIQGTENESPLWLKSPKLINRIRTRKKIEEIYKKIHV